MNEKLQYASMLEIPVSTCTVSVKEQKKKGLFKKKKQQNTEAVKEELIEKVNEEVENPFSLLPEEKEEKIQEQTESTVNIKQEKKQKGSKLKFSVIGLQLVIIGVLLATIFLTNAVYPDSGVNVFLRGMLGMEKEQMVDSRVYSDFAPVISLNEGSVTMQDGVMSFSGNDSVYAPCDGTVTSLEKGEDGKYTMEITHNANFKTVIGGLEYAYAGAGETIYYNIPVGYVGDGQTSMCFTNADGSIISNYTIVDNQVVWAV
mgnify:CR=1 FL=1